MKRAIALTVALLAGCGGGDVSGGQVGELPRGAPLEVEAEPALQVGAAEGDSSQILFQVTTPLLKSGRLYIPMAEGRINVYGTEGELEKVLGGSGRGPGEFEWLVSAWFRGDTLEAHDANLQRITQFAPDGSANVVRLEQVVFMPSVKGPLEQGWLLASIANPGNQARARDTLVLRKHSLDGSHVGEIYRVPGFARYLTSEGRHVPEPLSPAARVRTQRGQIFVGQTLTPTIAILDRRGDLIREVSWTTDREMDPEDAFAHMKELALQSANPDEMAAAKLRLDAAPVPEQISVWWDFLVDELGFIWIQPYKVERHAHELGGWRGAGPGGDWIVLDSTGEVVTTVTIPADLELTQIGDSSVVGMVRDEFGVERVRVHSLLRTYRGEGDR